MKGTPKGYVKEMCPPKAKQRLKSEASKGIPEVIKVDTCALPTMDGQNLKTSSPSTPLPTTGFSLLDSKRRKRNRSGAKRVAEPETGSTASDAENSNLASSKRRKKSWTSLKEIAQGSGHGIGNNFTNLTVPFFI